MDALGRAVFEENTIYLNPDMRAKGINWIQIAGGEINYQSKHRLILKEGELYFLILLHEIGHFKIKLRPPQEYYSARAKLRKLYPNDIKMQHYCAWDYLKPKKMETDEDYFARVLSFQTWLLGDYADNHIAVEEWGIAEFKKQRKKIIEIIKTTMATAK